MDTTWRPQNMLLNGVRLNAHTLGDGPPVVLLHGVMANARTWGRAAETLATRRRVIAVDQRGHGQSAKPEQGYAEADFVADLTALLGDFERPDLVGHSMGGRIAAQVAAAHPHLVRRLVLAEAVGGPPRPRPEVETLQMRRGAANWLERMRAQPRESLLEQLRAQHPGWTATELDAFIDGQLEFAPQMFGPGGLDYFWDWRSVLRRLTCPTLVLGGDASTRTFPPAGSDEAGLEEAGGLLKIGRAERIAGAGHMLHLDQPERFVQIVEAFLSAEDD
jgi:pimeloyl-ACP methyl ester carboxylesterase